MKLDRADFEKYTFTQSELSHLKMMALNYMYARPDSPDQTTPPSESQDYMTFKLSTDAANLTWYGSKILATNLMQTTDYSRLPFVGQSLEDRLVYQLFRLAQYVADNVITDADFVSFIEGRLDFIVSHVRGKDYTVGTAIESEYNLSLSDAIAIRDGKMDPNSDEYLSFVEYSGLFGKTVSEMVDSIITRRQQTETNMRLLRNKRTALKMAVRNATSRQQINDILATYGREVYQ